MIQEKTLAARCLCMSYGEFLRPGHAGREEASSNPAEAVLLLFCCAVEWLLPNGVVLTGELIPCLIGDLSREERVAASD